MITKKLHARRLHAGLFVAELICLSAFVLELSRALSGNVLSWAYVVEWPVLGAYAIYMWRRLLLEDGAPPPDVQLPTDIENIQLAAYNKFLAQVHSEDPRDLDEDTK